LREILGALSQKRALKTGNLAHGNREFTARIGDVAVQQQGRLFAFEKLAGIHAERGRQLADDSDGGIAHTPFDAAGRL